MANLVRRRPFPLMDPFFEDLVTTPFWYKGTSPEYSPCVDVTETNNQLVFDFDLPGMKKQDIKLEIDENILRVTGSREDVSEDTSERYHRREVSRGSFERQFALPSDVNPDTAKAEYRDGVLHVTVEKTKETKPQTHEVKVS
jgi:HSP20 family protein